MTRFGFLLLSSLVVVVDWGLCLSAGALPQADPVSHSRPTAPAGGPIAVKVTVDKKVYAPGDAVVIVMTVSNTTRSPVPLDFATGQRYDFTLYRGTSSDTPPIWQWSRGYLFPQFVSRTVLAAGASQTYTATLTFKVKTGPNNIAPLSAGSYCVMGNLMTMPRTARPAGTTTFSVK